MGIFNLNFFRILAGAICLLLALPFHECAHGYIAYKLGDPTAKNQGRLTLNPFKHLDILGAVSMVLLGIGWAKPVQINPYNFKNPKAGMAISAAAGPLSNLLLAYIFMALYKITLSISAVTAFGSTQICAFITMLLYYIVIINISLAIFNLLPFPPFDGSRIVNYFMPEHIYFKIMDYENYIMIGVFVLVFSGVLDRPFEFADNLIITLLDRLTFFLGVLS